MYSQKSLKEWTDLLEATTDEDNKDKVAQGEILRKDDIEIKQNLKSALMKHKTPHKVKMKIDLDNQQETRTIEKPIINKELKSILEGLVDDPGATSKILQESLRHVDSKIQALFEISKFLKTK